MTIDSAEEMLRGIKNTNLITFKGLILKTI